MKQPDGSAWVINCPKCDEPVLNIYADGIHFRASRFSVPLSDASVLGKYGRIVFNVWKGPTRLYAVYWVPSQGRPDAGRLYTQHFCSVHR